MRGVDGSLDGRVGVSAAGARLSASAWRAGVLLGADLPVASWSIGWDADRQIQGQATVVFADPWGEWAPWSMGDPLAPGGSLLDLAWLWEDGARVPFGWWRIRSASVQERYRWVDRPAGPPKPVPGGGLVRVRCDEMTAAAQMARLDGEAPARGATCLGEAARLLAPWMGVAAAPDVEDQPVPDQLEYGESRLDAVDSLLDAVRGRARIGPDSALQVLSREPGEVVWQVEGGPGGTLVAWERELSDDGLANRAVSFGQSEAGLPLVARADVGRGWLAVGGPLGVMPVFHDTDLVLSKDVWADAEKVLADQVAGQACDLALEVVTHPGVQIHDRVRVVWPGPGGESRRAEGDVVAMGLSSAGGVPAASMSLTLRAPLSSLGAG